MENLHVILLLIISAFVFGGESNEEAKLFIFGDSFVDTGLKYDPTNVCRYGITYPGRFFGRASNGRLLSDYVASFLNISCPSSYASMPNTTTQYGMNFAVGGSGVFNTWNKENVSVQIQRFHTLVEEKVFSKDDVENSIVMVVNSGNDMGYFLAQHGIKADLSALPKQIVDQLVMDLEKIINMGAKRILVSGARPMQCEPIAVREPYKNCVDPLTKYVLDHNNLLQQAVKRLKEENKNFTIIYMDIYSAFLNVISKRQSGNNNDYPNPLKPCCEILMPENQTVYCKDPELAFYVDSAHPTQSGWRDVFQIIKNSIQPI